MPEICETIPVPPPAPGATVRSFIECRTTAEGQREVVEMRHEVAVDGEWIDVHEMIDVWRKAHQ